MNIEKLKNMEGLKGVLTHVKTGFKIKVNKINQTTNNYLTETEFHGFTVVEGCEFQTEIHVKINPVNEDQWKYELTTDY